MSGGTDGRGENLGGNEERHGIRPELIEERRQEVHGLEGLATDRRRVVLVLKGGNDEEDKVHCESNHLHLLSSVKLIIDQERGKIVAH